MVKRKINKALVGNEEESKNDTSEFCLLGNSDKLLKHLEQVCLAKYDSNIPVGQKIGSLTPVVQLI